MHPNEPYIASFVGRMPESMTQRIDRSVTIQEMPYGYDDAPPPYDQENPASVAQMKAKTNKR